MPPKLAPSLQALERLAKRAAADPELSTERALRRKAGSRTEIGQHVPKSVFGCLEFPHINARPLSQFPIWYISTSATSTRGLPDNLSDCRDFLHIPAIPGQRFFCCHHC